jgi:ATP-dependent protease HslVU (ClpYQ) peptidase subunit
MTCIAAIIKEGKAYMAGERAIADDSHQMKSDTPKIWKVGDYLFGYCGTLEGQIIQNNFIPPKPEGNIDKFMRGKFLESLKQFYETWNIPAEKDSDFSLLICVKGKMYEHEAATLTMISYDTTYYAIGSGAAYAMGSLHATQNYKDPKRRLTHALDAAILYSPNCLYPVDFLSK